MRATLFTLDYQQRTIDDFLLGVSPDYQIHIGADILDELTRSGRGARRRDGNGD